MFLDTSGLLSLFDRDDALHDVARQRYAEARRLLTHNYVLAEFIPLVTVRRLPRLAAMDFVSDLWDHPLLEMDWVEETIHLAAMNLLRQRPDKAYSLCDAVSFLQMPQRGVMEALTTDRHFEQEGFVRLLKA